MKTIVRSGLAFIALLMLASICGAQCGPGRAKAAGGSVEEAIIAHEKQIIEAIKKRDMNAFKNLVDVNGTVVGMNGPAKISDIISDLFSPNLSFSKYDMESPQVIMIDKDAAILSYKSSSTTSYEGKSQSGTAYETSVFAKRGAKWVVIFHQSSDQPPATAGGAATPMPE